MVTPYRDSTPRPDAAPRVRRRASRCGRCGTLPLWIALMCGFGWRCTVRCPAGNAYRAAVKAEERAREFAARAP